MSILLFRIAAGLCFLAVALGAFGAHSLRSTLEQHGMSDVWNKAVLYHVVNPAVAGLAGICYSPRRALFPCRLGLVNDRTNKVIMVEPPVSAAFVPRPRRLVQASAWQANCFLIYSAVDVRRTSRSGARRDHGRRVYRDVFCRAWNWAISKASRRCSAWPAVSALLSNSRFLCRHRGVWRA